jgi:hypothetical protein
MKIVIQKTLKSFYPNPFIDTVNLKFSEKINEEITISIYDILGRILYKNLLLMTNWLLMKLMLIKELYHWVKKWIIDTLQNFKKSNFFNFIDLFYIKTVKL